ncbi:protein Flattop isoform X2 [Lynx rufus]|uniref:protein Flattop isoform X2 n=1 Tax=Lynx rufus TaxID=61384 RepID=UPI001F127473|nr:protein Flattop isoform X2 [Lynx rufus]
MRPLKNAAPGTHLILIRTTTQAVGQSSGLKYEKAFSPKYLQNWSPAKPTKERISSHEGYTQFIANDRGHLLPSVPRSKWLVLPPSPSGYRKIRIYSRPPTGCVLKSSASLRTQTVRGNSGSGSQRPYNKHQVPP